MDTKVTDRIEKTVTLKVPRSRVWRALTDHEEFGAWFKVRLDGPFAVGQTVTGQMTYPGFEHLPWESRTVALEPETYFAFQWPPYDPERDVSSEPWTLVEFRLADAPDGGTLLTLSESGFAALSPELRRKAFLSNSEGWAIQAENIRAHVDG